MKVVRNWSCFAMVFAFGFAGTALLPACASSDDPTPGGGASNAGAPNAGASNAGASNAGAPSAGASNTGNAAKGSPIYASECAGCHGPEAKGREGPNITISMTAGIGSWTYQQFRDAVRLGKDTDGTQMCFLMTPRAEEAVPEANMPDLFAYIRSLPISDVVELGSYVTGGSCK